jgi:hypothetical protein
VRRSIGIDFGPALAAYSTAGDATALAGDADRFGRVERGLAEMTADDHVRSALDHLEPRGHLAWGAPAVGRREVLEHELTGSVDLNGEGAERMEGTPEVGIERERGMVSSV